MRVKQEGVILKRHRIRGEATLSPQIGSASAAYQTKNDSNVIPGGGGGSLPLHDAMQCSFEDVF